ncbi:O-antigen ligase [Pseudoalteromonas sp. MQS005]|uniref:O-antigen ligase family protein n=1 Tax=Pseudoalteromonas sp. MQS005 TaxID=1854052 RepID=UPI0007E4E403|nr:O-antigen ligase family protein [Pseudoalteromonas sp. MQS005]
MLIRFSYLSLFFSLGILFFSRSFTFLFEMLPNGMASKVFTPISLFFYLMSLVIILKKVKYKRHFYYLSKAIVIPSIICFIAILSSLQSDYIVESFTASAGLTGTFLFAIALVISLDEKRLISVIVNPLIIALAISIFFALFIPSIGIDDGSNDPEHIGLWQGVFGFKNNLGRTAVFTVLLMIFQNYKGYKSRWYIWFIPFICLIMSKSTTPLICLIIVYSSFYFLNIYARLSKAVKFLLIPGIILLTYTMLTIVNYIVNDVFGKSLAGNRANLWEAVILNIDYKLFGYGFGGVFWGEGSPAEFLVGRGYYQLGHAHNGLIDAMIDMGYIGAILYPIVLVVPVFHSIKNLLSNESTYCLPFLILTFLMVYSISGSSFLKQNNILFLFYCVAIIYPAWRRINERHISYR